MLTTSLAFFISVSWAFESGSAGRVEVVAPDHVRVGAQGEKDQDGRNRQANWYSFKVDGVRPGTPVTIDLVDLPGEYNYQPNRGAVNAETPAVWSEDGRTWRHVEHFQYDPAEPGMRLRITPRRGHFWVAHTPPYTNQHLDRLWKNVRGSFRREQIGRSVDGRPLWLWSIGTGPKTIWLMFRQHSWETGTSWTGEGAIRELARNAALQKGYSWKILPLADPDGVARGGVRFNKYGFDLNRNWDVNGVEKMPEIAAQRKAMLASGQHGFPLSGKPCWPAARPHFSSRSITPRRASIWKVRRRPIPPSVPWASGLPRRSTLAPALPPPGPSASPPPWRRAA